MISEILVPVKDSSEPSNPDPVSMLILLESGSQPDTRTSVKLQPHSWAQFIDQIDIHSDVSSRSLHLLNLVASWHVYPLKCDILVTVEMCHVCLTAAINGSYPSGHVWCTSSRVNAQFCTAMLCAIVSFAAWSSSCPVLGMCQVAYPDTLLTNIVTLYEVCDVTMVSLPAVLSLADTN